MKRLIYIPLIFILMVSCHKKLDQKRKPLPPNPPTLSPTIGNMDVIELDIPKNNNEFAFRLFKKLSGDQPGKNLFISPYSISTAMAMVYGGAKTTTEMQMSEILLFSFDQDNFHKKVKELSDSLMARSDPKQVELNIANSIWAQKKYGFEDAYFELTKKYYNSGFQYVDFKNQSEKARKKINEWVEGETNEKIKNLIPEGALNNTTRMVLANAIYFNGKWEYPFNKKKTEKGPFYLTGGAEVEVDFMNLHKKQLAYLENQLLQAVELPYAGRNFSMIIILPKNKGEIERMERYVSRLNYENWLGSMEHMNIDVTIPAFKLESSFELSNYFREMGLDLPFSDQADFSGMTGKHDLKIDKILHKAFVEVNEEGTEAAASTAVIMMEKSVFKPEKRIHFVADHPFLFFIKDNQTQSILFMGKMMNPEL